MLEVGRYLAKYSLVRLRKDHVPIRKRLLPARHYNFTNIFLKMTKTYAI
jgi:hypothetical protein